MTMKRNVFQKNKRKTFRIKGGGKLRTSLKILKETPSLKSGIKGILEEKYPTLELLRAVENITDEEFQELLMLSGYQPVSQPVSQPVPQPIPEVLQNSPETELKKCNDTLLVLREQLQREHSLTDGFKKNAASLLDSVDSLTNTYKKNRYKITQLQEYLQTKTLSLEYLKALKKQDLAEFEQYYGQLQEEKTKLAEELHDSEQKLVEALGSLGEEKVMREARQKTLNDLRAKLAAAPKESDVLELTNQVKKLEQENAEKEELIKAAQAEWLHVAKECEEIDRANKATADELTQQLAEKEQELVKAKGAVQSFEGIVVPGLKQEILELEEERDGAAFSLRAVEAKLTEARKNVEKGKAQSARIKGTLEQCIGLLQSSKTNSELPINGSPRDEVVSVSPKPRLEVLLLEGLQGKLEQLEQYNLEKISLNGEVQRLEGELSELRAKNEELVRENSSLTAQLARSQQELQQKQTELLKATERERQNLFLYTNEIRKNFAEHQDVLQKEGIIADLENRLQANKRLTQETLRQQQALKLAQQAKKEELRQFVLNLQGEYTRHKVITDDKVETAGIRVSLFLQYKLALITLISFLESYGEDVDNWKQTLTELDRENDELDGKFVNKLKECDEAIAKLQRLEGVQQVLKAQHQETIEQLRASLAEFQARTPQLQELTERLEQLKDQNNLLKTAVSHVQTDAEVLRRTAVTKEDLAEEVRKVSGNLTLLHESQGLLIRSVQSQFATLTGNIGNIGLAIHNQSEAVTAAVRQSLGEKDAKFQGFQENIQRQVSEMKVLIGDIEEEKQRFNKLRVNFERLSERSVGLERELRSCNEEKTRAEQRSQASMAEAASARGSMAALQSALATLTGQKAASEASLQGARRNLEKAEREKQEIEMRAREASENKNKLEGQLSQATALSEQRQAALQTAQQETGTSKQQIVQLTEALRIAQSKEEEARRQKDAASQAENKATSDLQVQAGVKQLLETQKEAEEGKNRQLTENLALAGQALATAQEQAARDLAELQRRYEAEKAEVAAAHAAALQAAREEAQRSAEQSFALERAGHQAELTALKGEQDTRHIGIQQQHQAAQAAAQATAQATQDRLQADLARERATKGTLEAEVAQIREELKNLTTKFRNIFSPEIVFESGATPPLQDGGKYTLTPGTEVKFKVENGGTRSIVLFLYPDKTESVHISGDGPFTYMPKDGLSSYVAFKIQR